jgi:hypothetical protein
MRISIRNNLVEFGIGFVFALMSYIPVTAFCLFLELLGFNYGRTTVVLLCLFAGYPIGSILGIILADEVLFRAKRWSFVGTLLAVLLGSASGFLAIEMLDMLGGISSIVLPLMSVFFCLLGYNSVYFLRRASREGRRVPS